MFTSRAEVIADALACQTQKVAYIDGNPQIGVSQREGIL